MNIGDRVRHKLTGQLGVIIGKAGLQLMVRLDKSSIVLSLFEASFEGVE